MNNIIETDRIYLRPFRPDDIEQFAKICANPNVMRYIGDGKPVSHDVIAIKIPEWIELYEKQKYGLMALIFKETKALIGFCGFIHQIVDGDEYIELGYRLDEELTLRNFVFFVSLREKLNCECSFTGVKSASQLNFYLKSTKKYYVA